MTNGQESHRTNNVPETVLPQSAAGTEIGPATEASNDGVFRPQWSSQSPRGGRTVINRILKDGNKVPLFLGQTVINSLRDVGYNSTTSAICELVDNSLQWGAREIRVYFHQTGRRGDYKIDIAVLDNGQGMAPNVLQAATAFGGSMVFDNRAGIGRYGMGMKTAGLHVCPILDIYSWQEMNAVYNMTLDVEEVSNNKSNLIELPPPQLVAELPTELADMLIKTLHFPKDVHSQELVAENYEELPERLGKSGTLVFLPECDRLTYAKAETLAQDATREMSRVYRRFLANGIQIYINNRPLQPFDPTYSMPNARHTEIEELVQKTSKLFDSWTIDVPVAEGSKTLAPVNVRLYELPFGEWSRLPRKTLKNDLHLYDKHLVSLLRNNREVQVGAYRQLGMSSHHTNNYIRLEIDFTGELDEAMGIAANKQGVRPKDFVFKEISKKIKSQVQKLRAKIDQAKSKLAVEVQGSQLSEAELRANNVDELQSEPLPAPNPQTPEEAAILEAHLRGLATAIKREGETDDEAFERIKRSKYLTKFVNDEYWPFYHCDFQYGKVILTINTAHAFFKKLWEPLSYVAKAFDVSKLGGTNDGDGVLIEPEAAEQCADALVSLQLMLLSLARSQSEMTIHAEDGERDELFKLLQQKWSANLETQLRDDL